MIYYLDDAILPTTVIMVDVLNDGQEFSEYDLL